MNNTRQDEFDILNDNNNSNIGINNNNIDINNNNTNSEENKNDNINNKNNNDEILNQYLNLSNKKDSWNTPNNMKNLFLRAKNECYMIMRKDTFARWRFTEKFSHFYESLQPPTNAGINILID